MGKLIRSRLTYANVISTLALFLALGGAGYAALKLPKDSVGTRQLKDGAVTSRKLADRAVTAAKVKGPVPSAVSAGAEVTYTQNNGSLLLADVQALHTFQSLQLAAGTYIVTAKHDAQRASNGGGEVDCFIYDGSRQLDSFYSVLEQSNGTNASAVPMVGTAVVTLTAPATLTDRCEAFTSNDVILAAGKMWAIKVGTVKAQ